MSYTRLLALLLALCLIGAVSLHKARAAGPSLSHAGIDHVSGGIGQAERGSMQEQQARYSFWLTTAAKGSGAYLSGARVRILEASGRKSVLEHTMNGPWLFAALPPGRYQVEALYQESDAAPVQTARKMTTLRAGEHRQMIFYFTSTDAVEPENENPPGAPRKNGTR